MKNKVAIITLVGNSNYGNRLQNYALTKKINDLNKEAITIWKVKNYYIYTLKNIIKFILAIYKKEYKRYFNFFKFTKKYIKNDYTSNIDKVKNKYSKFVCGSDQVWNYSYKRFDKSQLLLFSSKEKNISYSASIGLNEISEDYKSLFKKSIENIEYVSVRENRAKEILEEITNRKDIEVLLDPTMLLSSNEWDEISSKPKNHNNNKKYILNYFLGNLSCERMNEIKRVAAENNCEIINILDKNSPYYTCGPSEFLYLEKNAFLICTDSFHSSVFAILYDVPFIVFEREDNIKNMNSRIVTLLSKFKLEDRKFKGTISTENLSHNYSEAYKILEEERQKSEKFLKKALL